MPFLVQRNSARCALPLVALETFARSPFGGLLARVREVGLVGGTPACPHLEGLPQPNPRWPAAVGCFGDLRHEGLPSSALSEDLAANTGEATIWKDTRCFAAWRSWMLFSLEGEGAFRDYITLSAMCDDRVLNGEHMPRHSASTPPNLEAGVSVGVRSASHAG